VRKWTMVLVFAIVGAASVACGGSGGGEPQGEVDMQEAIGERTLGGYEDLPFADILPMEKGEVRIDGADEDILIGFSQTCFNHPWRSAMLESVLLEANRHPNVDVVVTDGNCDIADQNNDVSDLLAQDVDAIIMSPVESSGLAPAATRVMETDIPLILLDRDVPTKKSLFIGQSNITMASAVAEQMVEDLDGKGKIVEITGLVGSSPAVDRSKGLKQAIKDEPGIEILATGDGEWIRDPAVKLMDDWLVRYDDIDAVFSHAEESSIGAQQAIARAGRCDENILHYTHDGSVAGFKAVERQQFQADGNYTPYIGDIGVRAALMELQGKDIPGAEGYDKPGLRLQLPDLPVVTPENAQEQIEQGRGWDYPDFPNPCGGK
jgi:ribose transport system substrate-binding protein